VERGAAGGRPRALFDGLSFEAAPGERLVIITRPNDPAAALARTIALLERPAGGRVVLQGEDVTRAWGGRLRALRRRLQYVGGEGRRALAPRLTLADLLAEPLNVHRLGVPAERRDRAAAAAQAWGLNPHLLAARPGDLSAAVCVRAVLVRALLLEPRVLICDHPTRGLEPSAAAPLLDRLAERCQAAGVTCLLLTPDAALARAFAGRSLRLQNGRLFPN
jgi:ABC-type glutathione transport system ATPase component